MTYLGDYRVQPSAPETRTTSTVPSRLQEEQLRLQQQLQLQQERKFQISRSTSFSFNDDRYRANNGVREAVICRSICRRSSDSDYHHYDYLHFDQPSNNTSAAEHRQTSLRSYQGLYLPMEKGVQLPSYRECTRIPNTPDVNQEVSNGELSGTSPGNCRSFDPKTRNEPSLLHEYAGVGRTSEIPESEAHGKLSPNASDLNQEVNNGEPSNTSPGNCQSLDPET